MEDVELEDQEDLLDDVPEAAQPAEGGCLLISEKEKQRVKKFFSCQPGTDLHPTLDNTKLYVQSIIAIHGAIIMWVGIWDLLNADRTDPQQRKWAVFDDSPLTIVGYIFVGLALIIFTDTYYANAAMNSPLDPREGVIPPWWQWWLSGWRTPGVQFLRYLVRSLLALLGMMLVWVGLNNAEESLFEESLLRDAMYLVVGVVILLATDTFYCMATIFPSHIINRRKVHHLTDQSIGMSEWLRDWWNEQAILFARCMASLLGQTLVWNSAFNLLEEYSDGSVLRELAYFFVGQILMVITGSYLTVSCIDYEDPIEAVSGKHKLPRRSAVFYVRVAVALTGQLMHNTGFWAILDEHISGDLLARNLIYTFIGIAMLLLTSSFYTNVGVVPPQFFKAHVDDEDEAPPVSAIHQEHAFDGIELQPTSLVADAGWASFNSKSTLNSPPSGLTVSSSAPATARTSSSSSPTKSQADPAASRSLSSQPQVMAVQAEGAWAQRSGSSSSVPEQGVAGPHAQRAGSESASVDSQGGQDATSSQA
eukprot:m.43886 g.43886  ORF g.43886 m.43886 type:complete len:534 (+) comp5800_c0_seq1:32-1633(+)